MPFPTLVLILAIIFNTVENDLAVFKRACVEAENSKRLLNEEVATLRKKLEHLDSQKSVRALHLDYLTYMLNSVFHLGGQTYYLSHRR